MKREAAERGQPSRPTVLRFFGEIIDSAIPPLERPRMICTLPGAMEWLP